MSRLSFPIPEVNRMDFDTEVAADGSLVVVCRYCGQTDAYDYNDPQEVLALSAQILVAARVHRARCIKRS